MKNTDKTNQDFCEALELDNKETLKILTNQYLSTLKYDDDKFENLQKIKRWVASQSCTNKVEISNKIIQTRPPIAAIVFSTQSNNETKKYELKINFNSTYFFYDIIKK